jgi:hypothetical protein
MAIKVGTENKKMVALAAGLGVVVIGLLVWEIGGYFGGPSTPPAPAAPVIHTVPAAEQSAGANGPSAEHIVVSNLAQLDPTLHPEIMAEAESLDYTGEGRNIFSLNSAPPKIETVRGPVRPSAAAAAMAAAVPAGPPPPPPIELKFFGYEAQGHDRKAFLLHGDDVFIAAEGQIVDRRYKIVKIAPLSIQITDLLFNSTQTLPLAQS